MFQCRSWSRSSESLTGYHPSFACLPAPHGSEKMDAAGFYLAVHLWRRTRMLAPGQVYSTPQLWQGRWRELDKAEWHSLQQELRCSVDLQKKKSMDKWKVVMVVVARHCINLLNYSENYHKLSGHDGKHLAFTWSKIWLVLMLDNNVLDKML